MDNKFEEYQAPQRTPSPHAVHSLIPKSRMINHVEKEKQVADFVERITGITQAEAKSPIRTRHIVRARTIYAYLMRLLGFSYPEIGMYLFRDHTTIINLVRGFERKGYKAEIWHKIIFEFPELSPNPQ